MQYRGLYAAGVGFLFLVQGWASPALAQQTSDYLIQDATIIRSTSNTRVANQDVLIRDGRIAAIGEDMPVPEGTQVIDGRGRYLMPGLWDMHAHIRHPLAASLILPQFLANGITGIREMNADCDGPQPEWVPCLEQMQTWQQQIESGEIPGPRFLALSSFQVNPPWDYQVTREQLEGLVAHEQSRGADFIKSYFRLSPEAFRWLIEIAEANGMSVSGHLPMQMTALEASEAGLRSLEHARDFLFDCYPGSAEFRSSARSQDPALPVLQQMVAGYSEALCAPTFAAFVANDTWYVPTHITRRMEALAHDQAFRQDERMRYVWAEVRQSWVADADNVVARGEQPAMSEALGAFYEKGLEITEQAHRAGVNIMVGTDSGDGFSFFGFGVHDELAELVKAGLSPAEAITAGTQAPARFLGLEADYGSVDVGKVADLLLLRGDPLEDIGNSDTIEAVFFNGRYHDRTALDAMLNDVEAAIREQETGDAQ